MWLDLPPGGFDALVVRRDGRCQSVTVGRLLAHASESASLPPSPPRPTARARRLLLAWLLVPRRRP